jgi:chemotaxis response regulator CheB
VKLKAHLANIEDAAVGAGAHKRADWRASAHIMQVVDPARYSSQQQGSTATHQTAIIVSAGGEEALRKLIASYCAPAPTALPSPNPIDGAQTIGI